MREETVVLIYFWWNTLERCVSVRQVASWCVVWDGWNSLVSVFLWVAAEMTCLLSDCSLETKVVTLIWMWPGCCLVTSPQCYQIPNQENYFIFSQVWDFCKYENFKNYLILFQFRLFCQCQNTLSPELNVLPSCCVLADFMKFKRDGEETAVGPRTLLRKAGAHMGCVPQESQSLPVGHQPSRFALKLWMSSCEASLRKSMCVCPWGTK